jgi:hypothetical protein
MYTSYYRLPMFTETCKVNNHIISRTRTFCHAFQDTGNRSGYRKSMLIEYRQKGSRWSRGEEIGRGGLSRSCDHCGPRSAHDRHLGLLTLTESHHLAHSTQHGDAGGSS